MGVRLALLFFTLFVVFVENRSVLFAQDAELRKYLSRHFNFTEKQATALSVFDLNSNKLLYSSNDDKALKPASVLKLVTSLVSLDTLGLDYRFNTTVWIDGGQGGHVDKLYLKGGGDPSLTIEELWILARRIKLAGIKSVGGLYLDESLFSDAYAKKGQRAYQAGAAALAFNFNSLRFIVCPSPSGSYAQIQTDPWEFPVEIAGQIRMVSKGSGVFSIDQMPPAAGKLRFKLNGSFGKRRSCEDIYRTVDKPSQYFGQVLKSFLEKLGVDVQRNTIAAAVVPVSARKIDTFRSKPIALIIRDLNIYSNNFIAQQLLSIIGCESKRSITQCSRESGIRVIEEYLRAKGAAAGEYVISDGSGLSHTNRITSRLLLKVLLMMLTDERYRPALEASLPVSGLSGTLKRRSFGRSGAVVRAKTGTLNGVRSLAGFVSIPGGRRYAFVLLQNQLRSRASAENLENKLVQTLYDHG